MNRLFFFFCLSLLSSITQAQLSIPEYHKGKALLNGKIANYNPNDNLPLKIGAPNILMGSAETLYPTIQPDGCFKIDIPIYHDTQVRMVLGNTDIVFLVSPGKETNISISLNSPQGKQFVFDGPYATINNEWLQPDLRTKIAPIYWDSNALDSIVGMSPNELKKRCIDQYQQYVEHNNSLKQFSEDTRTLANLSCAFDCLENLQAALYSLQTAYQKKENATREQALATFHNKNLPDDFYDDCLKNFPVNNPLAFYCYNFRKVCVTLYDTHNDHLALNNYLVANAPLTQDERTLIQRYKEAFTAGRAFEQENEVWDLTTKYGKETKEYGWQSYSHAKARLIQIMEDSTCQFIDFIRAINMRSSFYNFQPLTERQEKIASEITTPIFLGIIQDMAQQMQPQQKTEKKSFVIRETLQVPEKDLFKAIIERNKGKVQFIDFWATWCHGCRQMMKEYEPIKKEMSGKDVAFIYFTGPSSNAKAWDILIQDISGEHYWLGNEQWNYLWNYFQMKGLPMYLIVDKQGNISKQFTHITVKELKELLEEEANKIESF